MPDKKRPGFVARVVRLLTGLSLLLVILWVGLFLLFAPDLPDTSRLFHRAATPGVTILASDGSVLSKSGSLSGMVAAHDMPPYLLQAVIATEDRRFYSHFGLDVIGFARAMLANIRAGRVVQGGSTITQQLAKNLWLTPERTILRKIKELMLAIWLEARLDKDEILTVYLNRVYLGAGSYGVEAASQRYFGKSVREVTLNESALLAGLLKAPSYYAPTNDMGRARDRAGDVLDNMVEAGFLGRREATSAKRGSVRLAKGAAPGHSGEGYFVDWIESQIPLYVGRVDTDIVVETTLDPGMQATAESAVSSLLTRNGSRQNVGQGALVAFEPGGAVRAMVGGRSYRDSQFNRAVQAQRQPGSAFKPFVYLAALEKGLTPDSVLLDAPININGWKPSNFDDTYAGRITMETGLAKSVNTVAVRLAQQVGIDSVIATARRLGITSPLSADLGLALGTSEVSLFELTSAYLPFANGGQGVFPYGIRRIRTTEDKVLYERSGTTLGQVMAEDRVGQMNGMLTRTLVDGTGRMARLDNREAAGKTGTSQDYRDAWFVGYTGNLVTGVWVGNDDNSPTKRVTGGQLPALIWKSFMSRASAELVARSLPSGPSEVQHGKQAIRGLLDDISKFFSSFGDAKVKPATDHSAFENRSGE